MFWDIFDNKDNKDELLDKFNEIDEDFTACFFSADRDILDAESGWNALDIDAKECFADEWFDDPEFREFLARHGAVSGDDPNRETEQRLYKIASDKS